MSTNLVDEPVGNSQDDFAIPYSLRKGMIMTKVSENKIKTQKRVYFKLDPDEGQIVYESKKSGISASYLSSPPGEFFNYGAFNSTVAIETIKEIRSGYNARSYRIHFGFPEEAECRWMTIIYAREGAYKTLHMIPDTRDVFNMWDLSLRKLFAIRQGLMDGLGSMNLRQELWEHQYWKKADLENDQKLDFEQVEGLCYMLNANISTASLRILFDVCFS